LQSDDVIRESEGKLRLRAAAAERRRGRAEGSGYSVFGGESGEAQTKGWSFIWLNWLRALSA